MSNRLGIRRLSTVDANVTFTTDVVLRTVGLISPIAAGQSQVVRAFIPITVGATGGVRMQVVVPSGGAIFAAGIKLINTVAPSITTAEQNASAAFTNALANAGSHFLEVEVTVVNGATAGNIDIQLAQNTSDALTLTVLRGGWMDITIY